MKYYYEKSENWIGAGKIYICDHPLYHRCTLFQNGSKGLAIIQERFDEHTKKRWWGPIDPWLAGDIYLNDEFQSFFDEYASEPDEKGLYPTFPVRKIMWTFRMKPLRKEYWEYNL
jgi:hypothetical protein